MDDVSFNTLPCECVCYGVLVRISPGYPPPMGRLHTRYAPVRRSPAVYCYTPLPLDLHVLGLPLAFILSQDQTLHCKNFCSIPLTLRVPSEPHRARPRTHAISCFNLFNELSPPPLNLFPVFPAKASAKVQPFFKLPNFFCLFSLCGSPMVVAQRFKIEKKFRPRRK